jgi:asparagine synthetase B (glutamine-hydrolysing)
MTMIAGIFSRNSQPLADADCAQVRQLISRHPADEVKTFRDTRSFFAKVEIGAFGEAGSFTEPGGALSLLAGEPLLGDSNSNRLEDLTVIHKRASQNDWRVLQQAEGTFCLVHYQPQTATLSLVADKLGIRPLYFWIDDRQVVFATALRVLEGLSFVPKKMDLRAVTELVALGAPLGNRTPYAGISLLQPAEVVQITAAAHTRTCYWRWDEIKPSNVPEVECRATVYDQFQAATRRRLRSDRSTAAYLSGGLDSRCVVAALRDRGVRTHTLNFARPGTQDYLFGNDFAEKIESIHQSIPKERGDREPDYSELMALALEGFDETEFAAERPRVVWSGEGGSVLLGHVHLNESIVELMRAGQIDRAIETFVQREHIDVPLKLFRPRILESVRDVVVQGIRDELAEVRAEDAGRNFYLFLMRNDQRRKLTSHFENIDLHRLEFQLPFFDGRFLAAVIAMPLDWCLRHRFYLKWLALFPSPVTAAPWQAYPGHEPCPLPVPNNLAYQWDDAYLAEEDSSQGQNVIAQASQLLGSIDFPDQILNKSKFRLATWLHARGWRDYRYAIEAAQTYHLYAKKCGGEFILSSR